MERIIEIEVGEDLGAASVETRGGFVAGGEIGGKLLPTSGITEDD